MSITFIPTAHTWQSKNYYADNSRDARHGIIAFTNDEPQIQCHNSGGHTLLEFMGIEPDYVGEATPEQATEAFQKMAEALEHYQSDYLTAKRHAIEQFMYHCRYHQCGFTWG